MLDFRGISVAFFTCCTRILSLIGLGTSVYGENKS
jgi:hypothetical protein